MLNFNSLLIFSDKPDDLAQFYAKIFEVEPFMIESQYSSFKVGDSYITVGPHDQVRGQNQNPQRFMLNLETTEVDAEFERIRQLGATVIAEPYGFEGIEGKIATLADPDGNYFQLVTPMEMEKG